MLVMVFTGCCLICYLCLCWLLVGWLVFGFCCFDLVLCTYGYLLVTLGIIGCACLVCFEIRVLL